MCHSANLAAESSSLLHSCSSPKTGEDSIADALLDFADLGVGIVGLRLSKFPALLMGESAACSRGEAGMGEKVEFGEEARTDAEVVSLAMQPLEE